jgi:hypothetical protein
MRSMFWAWISSWSKLCDSRGADAIPVFVVSLRSTRYPNDSVSVLLCEECQLRSFVFELFKEVGR